MKTLPASGLAAALLIGLVFAWWPHSWSIAVAATALALSGIGGAFLTPEFRFDWRFAAAILLGLWAPAQLLVGASVQPALTAREAVYWGACSVAFVLASQILQSRTARGNFLKIILNASMVLAVVAVTQKFAFPNRILGLFPGPGTTFGTFYYENQFAAFMELTAPIALWRILRGDAIYGGTAFAIIFGATVVSSSRAGVVLILLEFVLIIGAGLSTRRLSFSIVGLIFLLLALAGAIVGTDPIRSRFEASGSEQVRFDAAKSTVVMIRHKPLTGYGMGTWRVVYPRFATFDIGLVVNEAHDDWLQWTTEGGLGFSGLLAILALALVLPAWRSLWGLGFAAVAVHSAVDYVLRAPPLALLWFVMGGALVGVRRNEITE